MLHELYTSDMLYVVAWAILGATLGFYTVRNKSEWTLGKKITEWFLSITVGVFFALPLYVYLIEETDTSKKLAILISGGLSFCITDIIISLWNTVKESIRRHLDISLSDFIASIINKIKKG